MSDTSKSNSPKFLLLLVGIAIAAPTATASSYEEKMLDLPAVKEAASRQNYDQFYRIIEWSEERLPSFAISVYISHKTTKLPERGFISFKAQKVGGKFWERSKQLTEKEAETISDLFESEEIFALPATPWSDRNPPAKGRVGGPGADYFVHVDKVRHTQEEVTRMFGISNPSKRVITGLGEILKDYIKAYDNDPKSPKKSWELEKNEGLK